LLIKACFVDGVAWATVRSEGEWHAVDLLARKVMTTMLIGRVPPPTSANVFGLVCQEDLPGQGGPETARRMATEIAGCRVMLEFEVV
jgi:hypothetical protein